MEVPERGPSKIQANENLGPILEDDELIRIGLSDPVRIQNKSNLF